MSSAKPQSKNRLSRKQQQCKRYNRKHSTGNKKTITAKNKKSPQLIKTLVMQQECYV